MEARKKKPLLSPSLQLRFKRAGLQLTDGKADVVLEAPRTEKLRGVLQRYGEWEYDRLRELLGAKDSSEDSSNSSNSLDSSNNNHNNNNNNSNSSSSSNNDSSSGSGNVNKDGGGAAESWRAEDPAEEASRHWEALNFMPQGKVAYLSAEHTPQKSLLQDQHLLRVTPKKGFVGSSVLAAFTAPTSTTPNSTAVSQPGTDGATLPQAAPLAPQQATATGSRQDALGEAMGQLSLEGAKEGLGAAGPGSAQNGTQGIGQGRSGGAESGASSRGKAEQGEKEADTGAQGQGQEQEQAKGKKAQKKAQASESAGHRAGQEAAKRERQRAERAEYMKSFGLPVSLLFPDEPDGSASGAAAMAVLDIPTLGDASSSSSSSGSEAALSSLVKHLDALHEALQCSYRGDKLFLQNKLLDAAQELNRGLAILSGLPDQIRADPPKKVSQEFKAFVLSALMQSLGVRARVMGCMGERFLERGETYKPIAYDLFHRMLRDCLVMVKADEEGAYGYTLGAVALSFRGEMEACMALLRRAGEVCKDKELPKSLQVWLAQLGHSILPGPQGPAKLAACEAVKLPEWAATARDDASLVARLQAKAEWRAVVARRVREETSFSFSAQSDLDHAALYRERPYRGHLVACDDEEVCTVGIGIRGISGVMAWCQQYLPHGGFNEIRCRKLGCKGGFGELGRCRKGAESKAARHVVAPGNLELARRCDEIGVREAWEGRTVQAAMWFTRGIVLLMPHGWDYGDELAPACRAAAKALVYNRSMMYLELETLLSYDKRMQVDNWHRAMADGLWAAYFGQGWDRANRSLASMLQYPLDCFSHPDALVEATNGYTELAPCLCTAHARRGAMPRLGFHELLRLLWSIADEPRKSLDHLSWLLEHTTCSVRYTKLWELGKGPRKPPKARETVL